MKTINTILTYSSEETKSVAENFSKQLNPGDFLALYGDLGSGKTTFVQGLVRGLGIKKRIISPTFIIVRKYKINKRDIRNLYHIDLYRTETLGDSDILGLDEVFEDKGSVVALEWPEKMGNLLPKKRREVHITPLGEGKRKILLKIKR